MLHRNCTPVKKALNLPYEYILRSMLTADWFLRSCVIRRVLSTSNGQDTMADIRAARAPLRDAFIVGESSNKLAVRNNSNNGSWQPENTMSLANVDWNPVYSPSTPFTLKTYSTLEKIRSERPTIICCFTISNGLRKMLATVSAAIDATTLQP